MEIKTENGNIDVVLGKYVYDEQSDTWITWDLLDEPTKAHLEALVNEATIYTLYTPLPLKYALFSFL